MVDFLKANPFVTMNDYMYKMSIAKIIIMSNDFTHTEYLTDKQIENRKMSMPDAIVETDQELMKFLPE